VRCIKDENGKVLSEDAEINVRWKKYFSKLLNDEVMEDFEVGIEKIARVYFTPNWMNLSVRTRLKRC